MSNRPKHNEQLDDFSKLIKSKLENHQMPVDEDCWKEIEPQLKSKDNKIWLWISSSVAVAAAILLLFIFYASNETSLDNSNIAIETEKQSDDKNITQKEPKKENFTPQRNYASNLRQPVKKQPDTIIDTTNYAQAKVPNDSIIIEDKTINDSQLTDNQNDSINSPPKEEKKQIYYTDGNDLKGIIIPKSNTEDKWLLAAAINAGGNISGISPHQSNAWDHNASEMDSGHGGIVSPGKDKGEPILTLDDFAEIKYSVPLSLGVYARKNLSNRIGIESGVVYTYLSTKFEKPKQGQHDAKLDIHYLGIPVNFVFYLWNGPKWNVYLTSGGMIEKGLRSSYKQNIYIGGDVNSTSVKSSVNGVQWSVNASAGASYRFVDNWSFYIEPKISYFFDNNQPISIRTDKSFVFGAGAGFRYEF